MIDADFNSRSIAQIKARGSEVAATGGRGQGALLPCGAWTLRAPDVSAPGDARAHACSQSLPVHGFICS